MTQEAGNQMAKHRAIVVQTRAAQQRQRAYDATHRRITEFMSYTLAMIVIVAALVSVAAMYTVDRVKMLALDIPGALGYDPEQQDIFGLGQTATRTGSGN